MRVLDLTHHIAGPYCTKLLADYGADVIKVERPGEGDGARRAGPFPEDIPDPEKSGLFLYLNTNKKGVTLNLKTETGVGILRRLVEESDILVENFSPRVMPKLGLDYQTLKKVKPQLVMTSVSNFGQTGPRRDWKATEVTFNAMSGLMNKRGDPDREPLKLALNVHQYFAGEVACLVTMATAIRNTATGSGEYIDVSILETVVSNINNGLFSYDISGEKGSRTTARNYDRYPFGGFPAADGFVAIQGTGRADAWMPRLCNLIGKPEFIDDPRLSTTEGQTELADEFNALLYAWLASHTKQEIFDKAAEVRYPMAPAYDTEELVNNPHYQERGFFVDIDHPRAGKLTYPGAPFRMSEAGYANRMPAPLLGQHNREVYCELLGYPEYDLSTLRRCGVI